MRPVKSAFLLSAALPLAWLSAPAYAQTTDDEVVVTGLRQAYLGDFEPLEIPQINQSIGLELLEDAGAFDLNDALDLSASVARQNSFGGLWNSFSIRGFSGDINLPSNFLVNGFNAGRGFAGPRDLSGIEAVEVLKGPRSALFGRGEPGGTINLVTKRPQFETGGYVQGTVGSWDEYRAEADFQTLLGESGAIRLVGFFEDAESFREARETQAFGFFPSVQFDFPQGSSLVYELEYTEQELPQDRGVIFSDTFGFSPRRVFTGEPDALIETKVLGHQLEFQHDFGNDWGLLLGVGYRETSLDGDAFENNFPFRQSYFNDGRTVTRFFRSRDYDSEYLTLRGEITGKFDTGALRHRLIVGMDYDEFDNDQVATRFRQGGIAGRTGADLTPDEAANFLLLDLDNPVYGQFPNTAALAGPQLDRLETTSGFGLYIQDQIDVTDRLQIRIGGRFDDFDQELVNRRGAAPVVSESENDRFSPQVGAVFEAAEGIALYASYGEGIRQLSGNDFQGDSFDPNQTQSAEFGIKADFGPLFDGVEGTASVTYFNVDQSNILVFDPVNAGELSAAGEAESQGVEIDANAVFENDLRLWISYAYTDAVYTNSFTDSATFTTFQPGERLINSPEHQLSLQAAKGFEVAAMPAELGAGLLYVGDRNGEVGGNFTLPDYTTVQVFGEIEPVENIRLRLDVDNLFDETFYTDSFANVWVQPGNPRRFRFTARYSF
ncbi:MAG: TonB-dependent siderophore receptor [Litorimonas sp.]